MPNYFLRAETKEEIEQKLIGAGLAYMTTGADGSQWLTESPGTFIDHIGPYIVFVNEVDETGKLVPPIIKDERWHTNIRTSSELTEAEKAYLPLIDPPKTPNRKFV